MAAAAFNIRGAGTIALVGNLAHQLAADNLGKADNGVQGYAGCRYRRRNGRDGGFGSVPVRCRGAIWPGLSVRQTDPGHHRLAAGGTWTCRGRAIAPDQPPTPVSSRMDGVGIQAQIVEILMSSPGRRQRPDQGHQPADPRPAQGKKQDDDGPTPGMAARESNNGWQEKQQRQGHGIASAGLTCATPSVRLFSNPCIAGLRSVHNCIQLMIRPPSTL